LHLCSDALRLSRWQINLKSPVNWMSFKQRVPLNTLFKTGMILSPRSCAMWNTEIVCAWTP
jgi:hypothetical protein